MQILCPWYVSNLMIALLKLQSFVFLANQSSKENILILLFSQLLVLYHKEAGESGWTTAQLHPSLKAIV